MMTTRGVLSEIAGNLRGVEEPGSITEIEHLDLPEVTTAIKTRPKYRYVGSVTTPPGVDFVLNEPLPLNVKI